MASGVAHDFNNILSVIIGYSEILIEDSFIKDQEKNILKKMLKAGNRGKELAHQILSFSKPSDKSTKPIDIQPILKEAIKLSRSTIPSAIEFTTKIQDDCALINGNSTEVFQVVMNLILNSYHAIEKPYGKILLKLKQQELFANNPQLLKTGVYAVLSVSDTGSGIKPEFLNKIFEPYFTTKNKDKGTGLGLATVYRIIRNYGGSITAESTLGQGATFTLYFPTVEKLNIENMS